MYAILGVEALNGERVQWYECATKFGEPCWTRSMVRAARFDSQPAANKTIEKLLGSDMIRSTEGHSVFIEAYYIVPV